MTTAAPSLPRPLAAEDVAPVRHRQRPRRGARIALHLAVVVLMILWAIPTIGLLISSFRPDSVLSTSGWWTAFAPPYHFTMANYSAVVNQQGIGRAFVNSLLIAVPATVIPIAVAAFAAYAFSRWSSPAATCCSWWWSGRWWYRCRPR